jgi:aspartyl/asparaginyl-tRNA synthetase
MSGVFTLHYSFKCQKYVDQLKLMEASLESFKQEGKDVNQWRRDALNQYVDHYIMFVKEYPKIIFKNDKGIH